MSDSKSLSQAIEELLALTVARRKSYKPKSGYEQVAATIIDKAVEDRDSSMLKYISDLLEKKAVKPAAVSKAQEKSKFAAFAAAADAGIDEEV